MPKRSPCSETIGCNNMKHKDTKCLTNKNKTNKKEKQTELEVILVDIFVSACILGSISEFGSHSTS